MKGLQTRLEAARIRAEIAEQRAREAAAREQERAIDNARRRSSIRQRRRAEAFESPPMSLGDYRNAVRGRLRPGSRPSPRSANWHLDTRTHEALRADCQSAERSLPIARALIKRKQALVVGDGAIVTSRSEDQAWGVVVDDWFARWADGDPGVDGTTPDPAGVRSLWDHYALVVKAWDTDGDILRNLIDAGPGAGSVQLVESRLVQSPAPVPGRTVVNGVELDSVGSHLAYWVASYTSGGAVSAGVIRVPAGPARLLTNPLDDTVGLVRGAPGLQAVIDDIERLDAYRDSHALAAEIATRLALIVYSDQPGAMRSALEDSSRQDGDDEGITIGSAVIPRAGVMFTSRGNSVSQVQPAAPNIRYSEYVLAELMLIGADLGVPVSSYVFDATGLSWSQLKAITGIAMRGLQRAQAVIARDVRAVRAWKVRGWMDAGMISRRDDYERCDVAMPGPPVMDQAAEIEALRNAVSANLLSHDQACQMLGSGRGRDVRRQRAAEIVDDAKNGTTPPDPPGTVRRPSVSDG